MRSNVLRSLLVALFSTVLVAGIAAAQNPPANDEPAQTSRPPGTKAPR